MTPPIAAVPSRTKHRLILGGAAFVFVEVAGWVFSSLTHWLAAPILVVLSAAVLYVVQENW